MTYVSFEDTGCLLRKAWHDSLKTCSKILSATPVKENLVRGESCPTFFDLKQVDQGPIIFLCSQGLGIRGTPLVRTPQSARPGCNA